MTHSEEMEIRALARTCENYYEDFETFLVVKAERYGLTDDIKRYFEQNESPTCGAVIGYVMRTTKGVMRK